jgi:hypothetical protein
MRVSVLASLFTCDRASFHYHSASSLKALAAPEIHSWCPEKPHHPYSGSFSKKLQDGCCRVSPSCPKCLLTNLHLP